MITAIWIFATVATAGAAPGDGDKLFEQGRDLADEGNYEAACKKFKRAFELDPAPGIQLNLADCHEHLGHLTRAWRLFQEAAKQWDEAGDARRAKFARDRAAEVAKRLATVVIGVPDPRLAGLTIRLGDHHVAPAAEIREVLDPGQVKIVARATGKLPFERTRSVSAGETVVIELAFADVPAPGTDPASKRSARLRIALGLGATGAAALLGSLSVSFYGRSKYNDAVDDPAHCDPGDPPRCDLVGAKKIHAAQQFTSVGTGLAIAGGAFAIASAIVYFTAPRGVRVAPLPADDSVGVALSARF